MKLKNYSVFKISGLNYEQLLNKLNKYKIEIINIKRKENDLFLTVEDKNVKNLIALSSSSCYNITKIKTYGFNSVFVFIKQNIGAVVALVFCVIAMLINFNFISSISIDGLERISKTEILQFLNKKNIKVHSLKQSINIKQLETDLLSSFEDLSIASVAIKGTTLKINLKEKIFVDILDGEKTNIVAPYNCQIITLTVTQGTALYKVGDSVKQGEVIVAGYRITENGTKEPIKAVAKIELNCFISSKLEVGARVTETVRTGKTKTQYCYFFNNTLLYNFKPNSPFKIYETKIEKTKMFNFIPFYVQKCTYYECEEITKNIDFEHEKETFKKQVQYATYEKINTDDEIIDEQFYITQQNNVNIIIFTLTIKRTI